MKRKILFLILFFASSVLFAVQTMQAFGIVMFHADFFEKKGTIIIDAGHGGEDGGAVGVNQVLEKEINLSIAQKLRENLQAHNFEVIMTREGDYSIGDQSLDTTAQRKRSDTKKRLEIVEETGSCILISIHQNHFSESKYHGAQMFYGKNHEKSPVLAEAIRQNIVNSLQPDNKRENKQGDQGVYLLEHCKVPCVLVECGFLSNPEEAGLLSEEGYQKKMADAIYNGLIDYYTAEAQS